MAETNRIILDSAKVGKIDRATARAAVEAVKAARDSASSKKGSGANTLSGKSRRPRAKE